MCKILRESGDAVIKEDGRHILLEVCKEDAYSKDKGLVAGTAPAIHTHFT